MITLSLGSDDFQHFKPFEKVLHVTSDDYKIVFQKQSVADIDLQTHKNWLKKWKFIPSKRMIKQAIQSVVVPFWIQMFGYRCSSPEFIIQMLQRSDGGWRFLPAKSICCEQKGFSSGVVKIGDCVQATSPNHELFVMITHVSLYTMTHKNKNTSVLSVFQIGSLQNTDNDLIFHFVWGKHYRLIDNDDPRIDTKFSSTWKFVQQDWTNDEWKINPTPIVTQSIDFPVLIRHQHVACDGGFGLDWQRLHDIWSQQYFDVLPETTEEKEGMCQLANFCDTHKKWISHSSQENCPDFDETHPCETNGEKFFWNMYLTFVLPETSHCCHETFL